MKRYIQYEPFVVTQLETVNWTLPPHTHDHFEMIVIQEGNGYHVINDNRFAYETGDVFLVGPADSHYFDISSQTRFCFLKFTESYFAGLATTGVDKWHQILTSILHTRFGWSGSLIIDRIDRQHLLVLLTVLLAENNDSGRPFAPTVVESIMKALMSFIARQFAHRPLKPNNSFSPATGLPPELFAYIYQHIYEPDKLRLEYVADVFNYSLNHLSALFKQQTGESLQQYIIRYKLQLVEKRLRFSSLSISQITDEFGFTDASHLNKLFKKYYQLKPSDYRRQAIY